MLRFLLDEHIPPQVASAFRKRRPEIAAISVPTYADGMLRGQDDESLLLWCRTGDRRTLVTYDQRTIRPLLKDWADQGLSHAGVIFVDEHTVSSSDIGGLVRALERLWDAMGSLDWADRVVYLTR